MENPACGARRSSLEAIIHRNRTRNGCGMRWLRTHEPPFLTGKAGRGRPVSWLEFWPEFLGEGRARVWTSQEDDSGTCIKGTKERRK